MLKVSVINTFKYCNDFGFMFLVLDTFSTQTNICCEKNPKGNKNEEHTDL